MSYQSNSSADASTVRRRLLAWYGACRRELPWRATDDPYRIWVAEVMLVQTQVDVVIPYYQRFLDRFPNLQALADADLDDVMKVWEGLGYYARARNLHRAACVVVEQHGGQVPDDAKRLRALPGVGPYIASALLSIAFSRSTLAIDGNVHRVISRLYDLLEPTEAVTRSMGSTLVEERPGDVNQALMDLGSRICTARSPRCVECPIKENCLASARGTIEQRPGRRPRRKRPHHDIAVGIVWRDGEILIAKRPPRGLLGGLWEFPGGKREPGESLRAALVREVGEELDIQVEPEEKIAEVDHAYSHFAITLHAFHCRYTTGSPKAVGCQEFAWVKPNELDRYAFPAANRQVLERLTRSQPTSD